MMRIGAIYANTQPAQRSMRGRDPPLGAASHQPHHRHARSVNLAARVLLAPWAHLLWPVRKPQMAAPPPICHMPSAICQLTTHHSPSLICHCPFTIVNRSLPIAYFAL